MMPRGRRILPKLYGFLGGVGSGLLWHVIDPPRILFYAVEAVLLTVAILLLPRSPKLLILTQLAN